MGILMNTRGIVQLVVLNIGVQLKVISPVIFAMFVLMATILTFLTSPILSVFYQRNADPKTLEESKTAHDLHLALEGESTLEKEKDDVLLRQMSNGSMKSNLRNGSLSSLSARIDTRLSFPGIIANGEGVSRTVQNNMGPRKQSRMTLF